MKKIIGQLKPYVPEEPAESVKARLGVERLVRLSANENPYGTSPKVRDAVLDYVTNNDANLYPDGNASSLRSVLADYWKVPDNQLVIGVGLACFDQLTGINTAMYYLPKILAAAGFSSADSITLNVITGAVACIGAGFGLYLVSKLARRHVGIYQETGVTLSLFALALIFGLGIGPYTLADGSISPEIPSYLPWLVLVLVSLFVFAKQSGTVNWVLVSEIFPARIRGVAQGFAVGCGWMMNAVVTWLFPIMIGHLGATWTYMTFGVINVVALCFYLFIVPETRGVSLEQFEHDFSRRYGV